MLCCGFIKNVNDSVTGLTFRRKNFNMLLQKSHGVLKACR